MGQKSRIRLYVDAQIGFGQPVELTQGQTHYLTKVMRRDVGDEVFVFNGKDGEWGATLVEIRKRSGLLRCESLRRTQTQEEHDSRGVITYFSLCAD